MLARTYLVHVGGFHGKIGHKSCIIELFVEGVVAVSKSVRYHIAIIGWTLVVFQDIVRSPPEKPLRRLIPMTCISRSKVSGYSFCSHKPSRAEGCFTSQALESQISVHRRRNLISHIGFLNFLISLCNRLLLLLGTLLPRRFGSIIA